MLPALLLHNFTDGDKQSWTAVGRSRSDLPEGFGKKVGHR